MSKLTWNEFKNLNGWGRHTHIWAGSGDYCKTLEDYEYYKQHRLKMSFPKNAPRSVFTALNYECDPVLRKKIREQTESDLKIVREQLKEMGEL